MKIIQVIPSFRLGGAETMCENLTAQLLDAGENVIVACLYDTDSAITRRLLERGADIRFLSKKNGLDLSMIAKLKELFKAEKPDVVHTHTHVIQYAVPAARQAGVPVLVHTVHNIATEEQVRPIRLASALFFRRWGVVPVALSERIQETIEQEYGLPKEKIPVIFNGVNLKRCIKKQSYEASQPFSILHVGRFDEQKNHRGLIRAFAHFHNSRPESELKLIGSGSLRGEMEALTKELGIDGAVRFLGEKDSVYEFMHEADIFAMPSNFEGMPMTLIEAMGSGLPIVATGVGGVPDMLRDGESAWLVPNDEEKIAEAFAFAAESAAEREKRGMAALTDSRRFSAELMAERYVELYRKLLNGRRP